MAGLRRIAGGRARALAAAGRALAAILLLLAAASCMDAPPAAPRGGEAARRAVSGGPDLDVYRLGPGDKIKIAVFGHPDESGEFVVDSEGMLPYSPIGRLRAQGLTVAELQEALRRELDRTLLVDPRVSAEVVNYRPFYIYGEVQRGGSYPYVSGLTVRRAIAIAGGFTRRARQEPVIVLREGREQATTRMEAALDMPVLPGDVIEVERRLF